MHDVSVLDVPVGSMAGYLTLEETNNWVKGVEDNWPELLKTVQIGTTVEQRPIYATCLGTTCSESGNQNNLPEVLYTSLHHAREPLSLMTLIHFIADVVKRYNSGEAGVLHLAATRRLWFVLVVNPDGYEWNYKHSPNGYGNHRKNRRPGCSMKDTHLGVDLNRNYPFCFGRDSKGSSKRPCAEDYEGPSAFSEPETTAIKNLVESHHFGTAFNYHSFGHAIYIPYSCEVPEGDNVFISRFAAGLNKQNRRYSWGRPFQMGLYSVNGDASDWMYNAHKIMAVSPEVAPDDDLKIAVEKLFWPTKEKIRALSVENLGMNYRGARVAGSFVEVTNLEVVDKNLKVTLVNQGMRGTNSVVRVALCQSCCGCASSQSSGNELPGLTNEQSATWKVTLLWDAKYDQLHIWDSTDLVVLETRGGAFGVGTPPPTASPPTGEGSETTPLPIASSSFTGGQQGSTGTDPPTNGIQQVNNSDVWVYGGVVLVVVVVVLFRMIWRICYSDRVSYSRVERKSELVQLSAISEEDETSDDDSETFTLDPI